MKRNYIVIAFIFVIVLFSCSDPVSSESGSSAKEIITYSFLADNNSEISTDITGTITDNLIELNVPSGTDISSLIATFTYSGKSITANGANQISNITENNFNEAITYTVTAEDGSTKLFYISINSVYSVEKSITSFSLLSANNISLSADIVGTINDSQITLIVPEGTNVTDLIVTFEITGSDIRVDGARIYSDSSAFDFTDNVVFTVIAEDNSEKEYTVSVQFENVTGLTYKVIESPSSKADFLSQANSEGSNGYVYKSCYVFSGNYYNIYVKNKSCAYTYSYHVLENEVDTDDLLDQLNTEGSNGYIWFGSFYFGTVIHNIYIKETSGTKKFSYHLLDVESSETDFLNQINTEGTSGYLWRGVNGTKSIFIKETSSSNIYSYKFEDTTSTAADFLIQANNNGADGYLWRTAYSFSASSTIKNIYVKDTSSSNTFAYHLKDSMNNTTDFVNQTNDEGESLYFWRSSYSFDSIKAVYYSIQQDTDLLTEVVFF